MESPKIYEVVSKNITLKENELRELVIEIDQDVPMMRSYICPNKFLWYAESKNKLKLLTETSSYFIKQVPLPERLVISFPESKAEKWDIKMWDEQ